jgi:hypothetical protein
MTRLEYERQRRAIQPTGNSSPSSSDSETNAIRDVAAQNVGNVTFQQQNNGQSALWAPQQSGTSAINYDPQYQYYPQSGTPGYTARATLDHELHHEDADRQYQHPQDNDLRAVNFHLPGQNVEAPALAASFDRQATTIERNWARVGEAAAADPAIRNNPQWAQYVQNRLEYVRASPHQHNESVAAEMVTTLNRGGLGGSQVANQVRAIYTEANARRSLGGEVRDVDRVVGSSSNRTSSWSNSLPEPGKRKPKKKG